MSTFEKNRIVVLGLDAFDVDLFHRFSAEGRLPFLTSLLSRGTFARLSSTQNLFGDAPWPSLSAGVTPAKHAFYNHLQLKRGTMRVERVDAHHCRFLPFWSRMANPHLRICVCDVPKTFPVPGVPGIQISAWGEHYPLLKKPTSLPAEAVETILRRFGSYPHPEEVTHDRSAFVERRVCRTLSRNLKKKLRATEYLLGLEPWDLFMSVFSEVHYLGHEMYHHLEPSHWAHRPSVPADMKESMPRLYTELDSALEQIFREIGDDATWLILSVHGFSTNYSINHLLPGLLESLGYTVPAPTAQPINGVGRWLHRLRAVRNALPSGAREWINGHLVPQSIHDKAYASAFAGSVDWSRTRAFALYGDHFQGLISVNLKGREPWGTVSEGREFETLCNELAADLKQLVDADTGQPLVHDVVRTDRIYDGPNLRELPDLVVQWNQHAHTNRVRHPRGGRIEMPGFQLRRTQHARDGFMIAGGRGVRKGVRLDHARTMDIAPTLMQLLGEEPPADMDGRVLEELLSSGAHRAAPALAAAASV